MAGAAWSMQIEHEIMAAAQWSGLPVSDVEVSVFDGKARAFYSVGSERRAFDIPLSTERYDVIHAQFPSGAYLTEGAGI